MSSLLISKQAFALMMIVIISLFAMAWATGTSEVRTTLLGAVLFFGGLAGSVWKHRTGLFIGSIGFVLVAIGAALAK
jgi:hypothetical protein